MTGREGETGSIPPQTSPYSSVQGSGVHVKRSKPAIESSDVLLLNLFPPPTSIYRYALTLKLALAERSRLVNFITHKEDRRRASLGAIEGEVVQGFHSGLVKWSMGVGPYFCSRIPAVRAMKRGSFR